MGVKRRLRKIIAGSIQSTKTIGNKTRKTIQSVLRLPNGKKSSEQQKCLGNFENSSKLELLSNEFEDDGGEGPEFNPNSSSGSCNQTHLVHVHVIPTSTSTSASILFEDVSQVPQIVSETLDSFHSQSQSPGTTDDQSPNVNSKHNRSQETEESIQVISVEQLPLSISAPTPVKSKLKRRLSLKGLKRKGKGFGKMMASGFKAMGNSMVFATHAIPVPYECPTSYVTRPGAVNWEDDYDYEEDRKKYISFWAQVLEKQREEQEQLSYRNDYRHRTLDTCHFQL